MRVEIRFEPQNKGGHDAFVRMYQGTSASYHENYKGQVGWDRILGWSGFIVYLERDKVVNFQRLGQDVAMFGGKIVS